MNTEEQIKSLLADAPFFLFMKGNPTFPQCGFSATVVGILNEYDLEFKTMNVLENPEIRQGVKDFADWPTIPQFYVKGEFVGGCDIIKQMHASGELSELLGKKPVEIMPPALNVTSAALKILKDAQADEEYKTLRFSVSPNYDYSLSFAPSEKGDIEENHDSITFIFDRQSAKRAAGICIDYVQSAEGAGFKITRPGE